MYNNLSGKMPIKKNRIAESGVTHNLALSEIDARVIAYMEPFHIFKAYIYELEGILSLESLNDVLGAIEKLDNYLKRLRELPEIQVIDDEDCLPDISQFYFDLGPLVFRKMREMVKEGIDSDSSHAFCDGLLEAVRISIEQEIAVWQEKS